MNHASDETLETRISGEYSPQWTIKETRSLFPKLSQLYFKPSKKKSNLDNEKRKPHESLRILTVGNLLLV